MREDQLYGLSIIAAAFIGILLFVFVGLLLGAVCLHWAVRILKFKKPAFRTAFITNAVLQLMPFAWAGALVAGEQLPLIESVVVGAITLVFIVLMATIVSALYGVSFGKGLLALLLSRAIWMVLGFAVVFLVMIALAAGGLVDSIFR